MLNQRQRSRVVPMLIVLMAVSVVGFLGTRVLADPVSLPAVDSYITTGEATSANLVEQNQIVATYLKTNHPAGRLTANWTIYVASLNYADYPSIALANLEMAEEIRNHQAVGLLPNWNRYQASLNWTDYLSSDLSDLPPTPSVDRQSMKPF